MRLLRFLAGTLLAATALAAKSSGDRYKDNVGKTPPFKLDDNSYGKLTSAPRDFAVAILLTAMKPQFGCQMCREFDPEWDLLSKSWTRGDKNGETRLLFATLDFVDGKSTFQSVGLLLART